MNPILLKQGYLHVPAFITQREALHLATEFKKFTTQQKLDGDHQVPLSSAAYNYLPFVLLLVNKVPEVNKLYGHYVLPTYTYARIYLKNADLKEHIDRDACEISLTVNLNKTCDWPIYFKTPAGETVSLELNPGDAVLYFGCERPHWRNSYEGEEHTQVFLHYVKAHGDRNWAFFDKAQKKSNLVNPLDPYLVQSIPVAKYV